MPPSSGCDILLFDLGTYVIRFMSYDLWRMIYDDNNDFMNVGFITTYLVVHIHLYRLRVLYKSMAR